MTECMRKSVSEHSFILIPGVDYAVPLNYTLSEKLDMLTIHKVTHLVAFNIQCNISNVYGYQLSNAYVNVFCKWQLVHLI